MNYLPPDFPPIEDSLDLAKVNGFCRRYTSDYYEEYRFGHFLLAAYASVPALLTPDLLYRIWMNFNIYPWGNQKEAIHRVAVSDLLLSSLCREIGYELYEMPDSIRFPFRKWLESGWEARGLSNPLEIAAFVEQYHTSDNPGTRRWGRNYADRQTIEAMSASNPVKAQAKILELLNKTKEEKKMERFRLLDQISRQKKLQQFIRGENPAGVHSLQYLPPEFEHNALLADLQKAALQQDEDSITALVNNNLHILREYVFNEKPEGESVALKAQGGTVQDIIRRPAIHTAIIAIDKYQDLPLNGCVNDAHAFSGFLQQYAEQKGLELKPLMLLDEDATVGAIERVFAHLNNSTNGDFCVFFFSGHAQNVPSDGTGRQFIVFENGADGKEAYISQAYLEEKLYPILAQKAVQCLWVFDTHEVRDEVYKAQLYALPLRKNAEGLKGSLVILNASLIGQQTHEIKHTDGKSAGAFTTALIEILKEGSTECSYRTLMNKVKLRMMQMVSHQPFLEAMPSYAADYRFLSDQLEKKAPFQIKYDQDAKSWHLQAGALQGVRPSLDFMHTIFRLKDGRKVIVKDVFPNYATLREFLEVDTQKTFEGYLVQSALPKVPIAYHASLPPDMRQRFEDAVKRYDIYYIDLIENIQEAKYNIQVEGSIVASKQSYSRAVYGLFRREQSAVPDDEPKPVFGYTDNTFEFIKQLEYIAQWTGVLEYDNQGSLKKDTVSVHFEVIEGEEIKRDNLNTLKGKSVEKTDIITARYLKLDGKWRQPAIRCRVASKTRSTIHISALLLGSSFGIQILEGGALEPMVQTRAAFLEEDEKWTGTIQFMVNGQKFNSLPLLIGKDAQGQDLKESYSYLKIFISDKPIDLQPLAQEALKLAGENTRSAGGDLERASIDFSDTEWMALTYPIRVVKAEVTSGDNQGETLKSLVQQGKPIQLRDLAQPQYAQTLKELRAKLCALGLLDPIITGDVQTPFKPTADGFENMEDTIVAQREFCRARGYDFDKEILTKGLLTALVEAEADDLFPMQLEDNESDDTDTRLAKAVFRQMREHGYWIARSPNMYNIVYVEGLNPDGSANDNKMDEWNDLRLVIALNKNGVPEIKVKDVCTTAPGQYYTQNPLNPDGAAHLALGQYKAWTVGLHQDRMPALKQLGPLRIHRDKNKTGYRDQHDPIEVGNAYGINQHGTGGETLPERVGRYGAGTLVGRDNAKHLAFMQLIEQDVRAQGNQGYLFMGTLMGAERIAFAKNQGGKEKGIGGIKVYGLFVGINAYNRSIIIDNMVRFPPLSGCVNDVEAVSQQLKSDSFFDCRFKLLIDSDATKAAIVDQFDRHLGQANPDDVVLFYFSGHGTIEETDTTIWTAEQDRRLESIVCYFTENESGKFLLADKELRYLLAKLSEKTKAHIVTIFDCCYSGDNTRGHELVADQTDRATIKKVDIVFPKRAWSDFVFSKSLQPSDFAGKGISDVLPQGRYLQMSASANNESALEVNGQGIFTKYLVENLRQTGGSISYRNLLTIIRNQMQGTFSQRPQLYTPENVADLESQSFLKKVTAVTSDKAILVFNTANEFRLNVGLVHGVEPGQTTVAVAGKNGQPVVGGIKWAFLDASVVDFGVNRTNVGTEPQTVDLGNFTKRLLRVHIDSRDRPNKGLKETLETLTQSANATFFALEDDPSKADCLLVKHRNHYYLAAASDGDRPLTMPLRSTTPDLAKILINYLRHVSLWKYALDLRNTGSADVLPPDALKIEFFDAATEAPLFIENGTVRPALTERQLVDRPGMAWRGGIKVKITNTTNADLYVAACYGSYDFSFNTRVLLDPAVPMLEPNNSKWLFDHRNNSVIPLKLDDSIRIFNWSESTETIKFIFSTEQFELSGFELSGLPGPVAQKRSTDAEGEEASIVPMRGWNTISVQLKVKNPLANTVDVAELQNIIGAVPNPNNSIMAQLLLNLYFDAVGTGSNKKWKLKSSINRRDSGSGEIDLEAAAAAWEAYWATEMEE